MKITVNINLEWWIARDEDGDLSLYENEPVKSYRKGFWFPTTGASYDLFAYDFLGILTSALHRNFDFSKVAWEDDEPKQLKDILKGEYKNGK